MNRDEELALVEVLMDGAGPELPGLADLVGRPAWMDGAACRGVDLEPFFGEATIARVAATVRRYCLRCPVLSECREFAIAQPDLQGIWGGTTTADRNKIRSKRRRAAEIADEEAWKPGEW